MYNVANNDFSKTDNRKLSKTTTFIQTSGENPDFHFLEINSVQIINTN